MKTLIVEDDLTNGTVLQGLMNSYGSSHIAANGKEAVEAVRLALGANQPYDLICLDIMMPEMDGHAALKLIRALEEDAGIWDTYRAKIVMITALLEDAHNATAAHMSLCDAYLAKPVDITKLLKILRQLALIA